jgi:hypothetical protein
VKREERRVESEERRVESEEWRGKSEERRGKSEERRGKSEEGRAEKKGSQGERSTNVLRPTKTEEELTSDQRERSPQPKLLKKLATVFVALAGTSEK